jgi:predicted transposase/invertase (TIGR01784 family)
MEDGLLSPSSDFVFANLFGAEKHKRMLVCLLNAILEGRPLVKSITLLNPQHKKQRKDGKSTTLDIEARTNDGSMVDIEIQCERDGNLVNRAGYHQARMMKDELDAGNSYDSCPNIISIWLTNYCETKRKHHISEAVYMFKENHLDKIEIASEKTRIILIELPKFDLSGASVDNMFSVWMSFLKKPELIPSKFLTEVPEVHEALEELKVLSADEKFRIQYRAYLRARNDRISRETNAEARGMAKGIAAGKAKGLAEGKAKGLAEGEAKKARETAIALLSKGIQEEIVSQCTGLSLKEVRALKKA